jgi:glycosyltransferase involved in cell wall biosynthesis
VPLESITALILARDEAANLAECLNALRWVDHRIVVVDSRSRDATESVARRLADSVIVRQFDDFASQRNAGLDLAGTPWIFAVDADERSSPEQAAEIRRRTSETQLAGFRVPIRSIVLRRPFRYSGTQHDLPLRLFRADRGRWVGEVHETVTLQGHVDQLQTPLRHQTIPDMTTFLRKIDHYTSLEALRHFREGRRSTLLDLTARPLWTFWKLYLAKQGFRDGLEGLAFCGLSAVSLAVREWKLRELIHEAGTAKAIGDMA